MLPLTGTCVDILNPAAFGHAVRVCVAIDIGKVTSPGTDRLDPVGSGPDAITAASNCRDSSSTPDI